MASIRSPTAFALYFGCAGLVIRSVSTTRMIRCGCSKNRPSCVTYAFLTPGCEMGMGQSFPQAHSVLMQTECAPVFLRGRPICPIVIPSTTAGTSSLWSRRLQSLLPKPRPRLGGQEFDQRRGGAGLLRRGEDAAREGRDLLQGVRQRPDDLDAGDRQQLADLLHAELGLAVRHDLA